MGQQIHDRYVKNLLKEIVGYQFQSHGPSVRFSYPGGITALIDGVIGNTCAIEVESRVAKQVRGALIDLIEHPFLNKLLILVPEHMGNPKSTARHCNYILNKYKEKDSKVKVILLKGTGHNPQIDEDKKIIQTALEELGYL